VAAQLNLTATVWPYGADRNKSLYRYQAAIRTYLSVRAYDEVAEELVTRITLEAAETMSDPADLINCAVETLQAAAIDLPAFSTLDRLVNRLRSEVHARIYSRIAELITTEHAVTLDALLVKQTNSMTTGFNRLKQAPGPATPRQSVCGSSGSIGWSICSIPTRCCRAWPIRSSASSLPKPRRSMWRPARYRPIRQALHAFAGSFASGPHALRDELVI